MNNTFIYEYHRDDSNSPHCFKTVDNDNLPHFHSSIEIIFVTQGKLSATVSGKYYEVSKGELLVISSFEIHMFHDKYPVEDIVLIIPIKYIPYFKEYFSSKTFAQKTVGKETTLKISEYIKTLLTLDFKYDYPIVRGYIYIILGILTKEVEIKDFDNKLYEPIQNILKYIENNYKDQISLESVAKEFGYSESRLSHVFNNYVGCSFPSFVNKLRSSNAAYLLTHKNFSTTDAAMDSGFESSRTFYRVFKQNYGVTPLQYKNSNSDISK